MLRYPCLIIIFIVSLSSVSVACQRETNTERVAHTNTAISRQSSITTITSTFTPSITPSPSPSSTATPTDTPIPQATPTPTHTVTSTLTPTVTPPPGERQVAGQRAFYHGIYTEARDIFANVYQETTISAQERGLALFWQGLSEMALRDYTAAQTTFTLFIEQYPDSETASAAYFNQALALEQAGTYQQTITAYQASLTPDSPIAAYIYERMGDLALKERDFVSAAEWYSSALETTEDIGFQVHMREGIATVRLAQNRPDAAIEQYDAILRIARIPAYRAKITRLKGEAYLAAEDVAAAAAQFQQALDQYPDAFDSYTGLIKLVDLEIPVDEFQRGYTDYYGGNAYQPAISAMERYLATEPETRADEAWWVIALAWRSLGNYDQALMAFDQLIDAYPTSERWFEAHLERARTIGWQGNIAGAIQHYRTFAGQYPDQALSPDAVWRAALLEMRQNQLDMAYINFNGVAQRYPQSQFAPQALYWAGMTAYRLERFDNAEPAWRDIVTYYPTSDFAPIASFWQAKALLASGRHEAAQPLLAELGAQPYSYYGLRAREILAADTLSPAALPDPTDRFAPATPAMQAEAEAWLAEWLGLTTVANLSGLDRHISHDPAFIRAEMLLKFGLVDDALDEYQRVYNQWQDNPLAMYQLALAFQTRRAYRLSILSAQRLVALSPADASTAPIFIRRLVYPTYYQDLVLPQAAAHNLDPALIFALMRQESLFEAQAHSYADARGLMQIIPLTGGDIAQRTNAADYTADHLWLPHLNVEFGTFYLRQMLNFLDHHSFAALAAYNAGPGNVQSWQPFPADLDLFVAQIPFTETRTYVRRIYVNLAHYRDIYR